MPLEQFSLRMRALFIAFTRCIKTFPPYYQDSSRQQGPKENPFSPKVRMIRLLNVIINKVIENEANVKEMPRRRCLLQETEICK